MFFFSRTKVAGQGFVQRPAKLPPFTDRLGVKAGCQSLHILTLQPALSDTLGENTLPVSLRKNKNPSILIWWQTCRFEGNTTYTHYIAICHWIDIHVLIIMSYTYTVSDHKQAHVNGLGTFCCKNENFSKVYL